MGDLLGHSVLLVTGKGGVGKSTVAQALARTAVMAGRRVLLVEFEALSRAAPLYGIARPGPEPVTLEPGLELLCLDAPMILRAFAIEQLRVEALVQLALGSKTVRAFFMSVPAIKSILFLYHLWQLESRHGRRGDRRWDLIICDLPTGGFVLGLYNVPGTLRQIFRVGPLAAYADGIAAMLLDPDRTGVVAVTLPEEMPVTETQEFARTLRQRHGIAVALLVANAVYPRALGEEELQLVEQALADGQRGEGEPLPEPRMAGVLWAAGQLQRRHLAGQALLDRLRGVAAPGLVELPHLFRRSLGRAEVDLLARLLADPVAMAPGPTT
jgi:anion-transporting  ArsA/GET3 family ATPase